MSGRMHDIRTVFVALLIAAALSVVADRVYFSDLEWKVRTSHLDRQLSDMESQAEDLLRTIEDTITDRGDVSVMFHNNTGSEAGKAGIILLVYEKGRIAYWSDNSIAFPVVYEDHFSEHKPVFFSNKWFIPVHRTFSDYQALALIKLYRQYPITNDLLRSGFPEWFWLPGSTGITFDESATPFHIMGSEDEFHFGLIFPQKKPNTVFIVIPVLFWLVVLFFMVRLVVLVANRLFRGAGKGFAAPVALALLLLIYLILLLTGMPPSVSSTDLFSPFHWSAGPLLPSVGHVLLLGLFIASGLKIIFRSDEFSRPARGGQKRHLVASGAMLATGFVAFMAGEALFRDLVLDSAVSFRAYRILDVSFMSVAGFISVLLILSAPVILFMRAFMMLKERPLKTALIITGAAALLLPLACLTLTQCSYLGVLYILLLAGTVLLWQRKAYTIPALLVAFSLLTALFSTFVVLKYSDIKEDRNMEVMAISLANDNDMVAEDMLIDMWPDLKNDTILARMMKHETISAADINSVYRYLEDAYFNGYWENYDLYIVICRSDSPLDLGDQGGKADNCFSWFDERINREGEPITNTGFWFMQNQSGRAWYFSRLLYDVSPSFSNGLFIELVSHIETYLAGYPELLLDGSHQRTPRLDEISYAKYSGNTLVLRSGGYPYDSTIDPDLSAKGDYSYKTQGNYRHLTYSRGDMTLVLTAEAVTPVDRLITFAYLFIVTLAFAFTVLVIFTRDPRALLRFDTFRRRLQLSLSALLAVVFIIIIAGAIMLTTRQFINNHTRVLREKATSLSIELEHKLSSEQTLDEGWQTEDYATLNQLLVKFSNVFFTDINLYSPSGMLLATSRPEVFTRKLEGSMIDPVAYGVLTEPGKEEYIGEETIGGMRYLSAYLPFYNSENQLLAYLNVPYFAMQNLLAGEVSNLVVTLINFTLLFLVLMMWVAVFLSRRITAPLYMLQQAMASVEYGKKNEHIRYSGHDEVGELVKQYNRMTDELEESASKLARTEREMAWREMARQIAHEIKNPLTPMKLNVQQLYKWWNDRVPDFDEKLRSFTDHQIEYIDNLSNIATAFSYFARLPAAQPAEVDLIAQLKTTIGIFGNVSNATVTLNSGNLTKAVVMADREHLNGIFSNLLKNALQAIPSDNNGLIDIVISVTGDKVQVRFADNGIGIPEELRSRMFTPNFTTKSSGMGLGLSIVKRYVETAGGTVWFETENEKGTAFIVELPLLYAL
jgi:signal transduction histidine kinase